jgi:L-asparaginase II
VPGPFETDPVLVEVVRNGFVESVHHGRVVLTNPDESLAASVGADFAPMYPRSASKPLQAVGMLRAGLDLDGGLLALVAASHSGEAFHLEGVRRILADAGLEEAALQTPPDWPLDAAARKAAICSGQPPTPLTMNCSGKHAGMLATCVANGWPYESYLDPEHRVQLAILRALDDLSGQQAGNVALDGCGAPLYAFSLFGLARAFGRMAAASDGPEARVAAALRDHPAYASGTHRDENALHQAVPGLITKAGTEAVQAVGLPDGRGLAVKISDGSPRARAVAVAGVLRRLGFDHPILTEQASAPVLGHGERVGEIRPSAETLDHLAA